MRIYCSGPITNIPDHNRAAFDAAAKRLREQGHFVINPAELSLTFGTADAVARSFNDLYDKQERHICRPDSWTRLAQCVMDADLAAVRSCDAIYLLRGWENSRGAKKELAEAVRCGLEVRQEGDAE